MLWRNIVYSIFFLLFCYSMPSQTVPISHFPFPSSNSNVVRLYGLCMFDFEEMEINGKMFSVGE